MKKNELNIKQAMENTVYPINTPNIRFHDLKFLYLKDIVGDKKKGIDGILPISRSTWFAGIKAGKYPKPTHISTRRVAWKYTEIVNLVYSFPNYGEAA